MMTMRMGMMMMMTIVGEGDGVVEDVPHGTIIGKVVMGVVQTPMTRPTPKVVIMGITGNGITGTLGDEMSQKNGTGDVMPMTPYVISCLTELKSPSHGNTLSVVLEWPWSLADGPMPALSSSFCHA